MFKNRINHPSHHAPSIVQIPKPLHNTIQSKQMPQIHQPIPSTHNNLSFTHIFNLQPVHKNNHKDKKKFMRITSNGIPSQENKIQLEDSQTINPEQNIISLKAQSTEFCQLQGDTSDHPLLSVSQIKTSLICSTVLPSLTNRTRICSTSRIPLKPKPPILFGIPVSKITTKSDNYDVLQIMQQNQFLKLENQKLKQLSDERKNQISILLQQIMELKVEVSRIFENSDMKAEVDNEIRTENEDENEEDQFCVIERSLNQNKSKYIVENTQKREGKFSLSSCMMKKQILNLIGITKDSKENKENRKLIAKQIKRKLREISPHKSDI